jgi:hypothetical protein
MEDEIKSYPKLDWDPSPIQWKPMPFLKMWLENNPPDEETDTEKDNQDD